MLDRHYIGESCNAECAWTLVEENIFVECDKITEKYKKPGIIKSSKQIEGRKEDRYDSNSFDKRKF